ncbi:unnamed protein product [Trichobilharzia szidati]|nr:unnamed protein product [Trichobilharzia szidati]
MTTCISFDENSVYNFLSRKWALDFNSRPRTAAPIPTSAPELKHPPGYVDRSFPATAVRDSDPHLMRQRSWNIALGPFRQVPMNLFIMWISGSSISIFPLMSVIMLFLRPLQALFSAQNTFNLIEGSQATIQCCVYVLGNLVILALAMYKCHTMGLLPTYASDWLSFIESPQAAEWSAGGYVV